MAGFLCGSRVKGMVAACWAGSVIALAVLACRPAPDAPEESAPVNPFLIDHTPRADSPPAKSAGQPADCPIQLRDVSDLTGITFVHHDGSSGLRYVVEAMSAGVATFDYDRDGLIDIYFPNGAPLPGCEPEEIPRHAMYRNLGDWTFQDVTQEAGLVCTTYGMGATIGDFDNDGFPDLYVSNFGPNLLFRNNGDGTFTDVTAEMGVGREEPGDIIGAGVSFLDINGNGNLDLYVGNYIRLDCATHIPRTDDGYGAYPSPREYEPIPDTLYRNEGGSGFTDISESSGVAAHAGRSMGLIAADVNNNGSTDVFICNDVMANFLMLNDGNGFFQESALVAGTALNLHGEMVANMGVDAVDFDHDGWLDFYTTNYQGQLPMLFRNIGGAMFIESATVTGADSGCYQHVNWGGGFADFDNDGHSDLFIANGHTEDNIEQRDRSACYRCPNVLLRNQGNGRFTDVSALAGDGLAAVQASRGTAFEDLDNDGDVDVVILNSRARPTVLRNMLQESSCAHHWVQIRLVWTGKDSDTEHRPLGDAGHAVHTALQRGPRVCSRTLRSDDRQAYGSGRSSRQSTGQPQAPRVYRRSISDLG